MKDLSAIKESVNDLAYDIKAEIVIADLLENGLNPQDYLVFSDGLFRRRFKKDVTHSDLIELNNGHEILGIHITREGIYDSLPEAIFHGPPTEGLNSGHEMAKASKTQKMEEKESRTFFLPFENEIFFQKIQLELSERKILQRFSENLFNDIFPGFWNVDRSLPKELVSKLMLFLHYTHKFVGNLDLTAKALEVILNEPVIAHLILNPVNPDVNPFQDYQSPSVLGSSSLGQDMICGNQSEDQFTLMEFDIGPLKNTRIEDYLENGRIARFLDVFFSYFIPLDITAIINIKGYAVRQEFVLSEKGLSFLGFNTILN
ncbi:MAG: hypothetical protein NTV01_01700 [Bacteroidia bacterium]|nr:hypothetical protein [Bacteroidia bacterium]